MCEEVFEHVRQDTSDTNDDHGGGGGGTNNKKALQENHENDVGFCVHDKQNNLNVFQAPNYQVMTNVTSGSFMVLLVL